MEQVAYFGAGCFWGVEENFRTTPGVKETEVGYGGGEQPNPSYQQVCTGSTGHVELCKVVFNSDEISYESLVDRFFEIHDPTTLNRQGVDVGAQYRSVLFVVDSQQKELAQKVLERWQKDSKYAGKIVTSIEPFKNYFRAEEHHQKYAQRNGWSCAH